MKHFIQPFITSVFIMSITVMASIPNCFNQRFARIGNYTIACWRQKGPRLDIYCHGYLSTNFANKMKNTFPFIIEIVFRNCTFLETPILQNMLHTINITSYGSIAFDNCHPPNRFNLQTLSGPELVFKDSNFSELPYDMIYDVLDVRKIQIVRTQLVRIPENFFSDWASSLFRLDLYSNRLRKIAKDDFARLVNLVVLDLNENEIEEIEEGAFDNLINLDELVLSTNRLHILLPGIFRKLTSLTIIIFNLYVGNIKTPIKNTTLYQMKSLPSDVFKSLSELVMIDIGGHDLRNLPVGIFNDNKNLERLLLYNNGLESLPVGIFRVLESLMWLDLTNNRLTSLPSTNFIGLHSLEFLHASMNNLTYIDLQLFKNLKSATEIVLSHNEIAYFLYEDKKQLQIDRAFSSMNNFTDISEKQNFERVMSLDLSFNNFSEFDMDFIEILKYSAVVDLSNNHMSKVNLTELSSRMPKMDCFNASNTIFQYVKFYLGNNLLHCDCNIMNFIHYLNGSSHQELQKYVMILANEESIFGEGFITCSSPPELKHRDVRTIRLEELYCPFQTDIVGDACNETCKCREYPGKQVLFVDCSLRNLTQLPLIINNAHNWSIELNMSNNALQRTPSLNHSCLIKITRLDLSSNNITEVSLSSFSPKLQDLKLHNNSISRLDPELIHYLAHDNPLRSLTLHNNRWKCDCESHKVVYSYGRKNLRRYNFHEILCYGSNRKLYEVAISELCEDKKILIISASLSIAVFGIVVSSLAALYYRYQKQIKVWLYSRELCLWFITDDELDRDKKFDAFISFAHKDEEFVEKEIVAKLEEGHRPYKLCLHYRDWLAGEWIPLQISRSVADSRRTVIILTPDFLESVWGLLEFRTAHIQALTEGRARLIIILHGEIGNLDELDPDLKDYLSMNTYIKWGDPWFWQKLKYALPHRSGNARMKKNQVAVHYRVNSDNNASAAENHETISIS